MTPGHDDPAALRRAAGWMARVAGQPRVLLAIKTAVAATLAWYLAPLIPFAEDQYSYYGPLGVLVTMHPTVARSLRVGGQALVGLALGIALGLGGMALAQLDVPAGLVLAAIVLVAVLIGGFRRLGAGRDWIALAALFVLVAGNDAADFSVSYLVTMGFGVIVGVVVNLVIVPPLYLRRASERLSDLRGAIVRVLEELADAIARQCLDGERLGTAIDGLGDVIAAVSDDVAEGDESRRVNPRGRRHTNERDENARRLTALERTSFLTRDLVDVVLHMDAAGHTSLTTALRHDLALAVRRTAELVSAPLGAEQAPDLLSAASAALETYERALASGPVPDVANEAGVVLALRRIIDVSRDFV